MPRVWQVVVLFAASLLAAIVIFRAGFAAAGRAEAWVWDQTSERLAGVVWVRAHDGHRHAVYSVGRPAVTLPEALTGWDGGPLQCTWAVESTPGEVQFGAPRSVIRRTRATCEAISPESGRGGVYGRVSADPATMAKVGTALSAQGRAGADALVRVAASNGASEVIETIPVPGWLTAVMLFAGAWALVGGAVALSSWAVFVEWRAARRHTAGCCYRCGYSRADLPDPDRCPECGESWYTDAPAPAARDQ